MSEHSIDFKVVWIQTYQFAARAEKIHTTPGRLRLGSWEERKNSGLSYRQISRSGKDK
jgi:hypothetical protein